MVKDSTRAHLLYLRNKYGTAVAIDVAKKSLAVSASDGEFKKQFNGEICETVLEIIIQDLVKKNPEWFYLKSLVIPDAAGNNPEFLTEIDFVLFTKNEFEYLAPDFILYAVFCCGNPGFSSYGLSQSSNTNKCL